MIPPLELAHSSGAKASNLAMALGILPADRREDALVFYSFCRVIDDIADDPDGSEAEKRDLLRRWRDAIAHPAKLPAPFADLMDRRDLDPELLCAIVDGVASDIVPLRFETFEDLRAYCWQVASAVGLVSIQIFGATDPGSRHYAEQLGYALQITNILRDVGEDAQLGRVYLPVEDCEKFGVDETSLRNLQPSGDFAGLMRFEAARARAYFAAARAALPAADASALAPAEIMRAMYERLLNRMEKGGFRVCETRYRLSKAEKLLLLGKAWISNLARPAAATV